MSSVREIISNIAEQAESEAILLSEEMDSAIIGVQSKDDHVIAVYSETKILNILQNTMGCDREEALEYFEFNIESAYLGENTPIYIYDSFLEVE